MNRSRPAGPARGWQHRYPPLSSAIAALLLVAFVLPSSLNVPQTNPTQTLEFAPVPPSDDDPPPPPTGNSSSLSLGTSSGPTDGDLGDLGPPPDPDGRGASPRTKRCVGSPPRQTEDPLSPPCVAHFKGDNFGATHQGVSKDEITVLLYVDAKVHSGTQNGTDDETRHFGKIFDLGKPPEDEESISLRTLRRFQRYFNLRFQLYDRRVRFLVHFAGQRNDQKSPETRRKEAAEAYAAHKPFAVITSGVVDGFQDEYLEAMAAKGVMVFGSGQGSRKHEFLQRHPGLLWTVPPTLEKQAALASSFICEKVVGKPVVDAGDAAMIGKPRKLGFLHTTDGRFPDLVRYAELVKAKVEACGGQFAAEATFPWAGQQYQSNKTLQYGTQNMAKFKQAGVTTIIWGGGLESEHSAAAAQLDYRPEIVIAGDRVIEGNNNGRIQEQTVWDHAWVASTIVRLRDRKEERPCWIAVREVDPSASPTDIGHGCEQLPYYQDLLQLFTGIQVAGPRLTPLTVDQGLHAIPGVRSSDPFVPACFYDPGDYSCIKDAVALHWDPNGMPGEGVAQPGCYRMAYAGQRYIGDWPDGNLTDDTSDEDPCLDLEIATPLFAPATPPR